MHAVALRSFTVGGKACSIAVQCHLAILHGNIFLLASCIY